MRNALFILSALTLTVAVGFAASTARAGGIDLWAPVPIQPIYPAQAPVPAPATPSTGIAPTAGR